ncbi:peptidase M48-like protein [Glaciihabitans tibetensis]|uniref:Peptidase M48-like protein n=1 Tax=Glaciihabitans tibetensis TaxID=1266600 RepID=A0A2T0VAK8_9MICO|nr:M56 family metallopeptidase [Glaciihabitans tibetensis]PRY67222.1 peptidase M48-like protein [Glaciihabitans tibetensis]
MPVVLARATWPWRAPATALLLWQGIALAGGLSMIGSLLAFGLVPFGDNLFTSADGLLRALMTGSTISTVDVLHLASLCGAVLLGLHLVLNLVLTIVVSERQRRRHRQLVELLSSPVPGSPHTRLIDHSVPVAYCLPGTAHSVTVFSAGLLELLGDRELAGVIEHEKAHLLQRHYMVLMAFGAWRSSLPWFPIATRAHREVALLVEMLADDYARRVVDDQTLATAIALVSSETPRAVTASEPYDSWAPAAVSREQLAARVGRLIDGRPPVAVPGRILVVAVALALVVVPTVLLVLPSA